MEVHDIQFMFRFSYPPSQAAEVYRGKAYDPYAADVWSLGIVFYVMETGMPLYERVGDKAFCALEKGRFEELVNHYSNMGYSVAQGPTRELIRSMLHPIPSQRPSPQEILEKLSCDFHDEP